MRRLVAAGVVFESPHSRAEVRDAALAAGAPQEGHAPMVFPRSMRPTDPAAWRFQDEGVNHRVAMPDGIERVHDEVLGDRDEQPAREHGDCIVWAKAGIPSYQLACAVDDGELGVTDVVRGEDLLTSAAVQQRLLGWLGHAVPRWWHLPLVRDAEGRRLAKRDGDEGLAALRDAGASADRVRGLVALWLGLAARPVPMATRALLELAEPERVTLGARALAERGGARIGAACAAWLRGSDAAADTLARDA
jgi:glutamyl-tRNA synthetase